MKKRTLVFSALLLGVVSTAVLAETITPGTDDTTMASYPPALGFNTNKMLCSQHECRVVTKPSGATVTECACDTATEKTSDICTVTPTAGGCPMAPDGGTTIAPGWTKPSYLVTPAGTTHTLAANGTATTTYSEFCANQPGAAPCLNDAGMLDPSVVPTRDAAAPPVLALPDGTSKTLTGTQTTTYSQFCASQPGAAPCLDTATKLSTSVIPTLTNYVPWTAVEGTGSLTSTASNTLVNGADPRLSDSRPPIGDIHAITPVYLKSGTATAHATSVAINSTPAVGVSDATTAANGLENALDKSKMDAFTGGAASTPIPSAPALIGSVSIGSNPTSVFVSGRYAYTANYGGNTVSIIDISIPSSPIVVGTVSVPGGVISIFVAGKYAYTANYYPDSTMSIIDVSKPTAPTLVASVAVGLYPHGVYVSGRYAYTAGTGDGDLTVVDISVPTVPIAVRTVSVGAGCFGVFVLGSYAYTVNYDASTLSIIDVSVPAAPVLKGTVAVGTHPNAIYVISHYAYVANLSSNTMSVVDVTTPTAPAVVGTLALTYHLGGIYVSGHYVYTTVYGTGASDGYLAIIDVSVPTAPTLVGVMASLNYPVDLYITGRYAYVIESVPHLLLAIDLNSGLVSSTAEISSLEADDVKLRKDLNVFGDANIQGNEHIGGDAVLDSNLVAAGYAQAANVFASKNCNVYVTGTGTNTAAWTATTTQTSLGQYMILSDTCTNYLPSPMPFVCPSGMTCAGKTDSTTSTSTATGTGTFYQTAAIPVSGTVTATATGLGGTLNATYIPVASLTSTSTGTTTSLANSRISQNAGSDDVAGTLRATPTTLYPSAGKGLELKYDSNDDKSLIMSIDRDGPAYKDLLIQGKATTLQGSGAVNISSASSVALNDGVGDTCSLATGALTCGLAYVSAGNVLASKNCNVYVTGSGTGTATTTWTATTTSITLGQYAILSNTCTNTNTVTGTGNTVGVSSGLVTSVSTTSYLVPNTVTGSGNTVSVSSGIVTSVSTTSYVKDGLSAFAGLVDYTATYDTGDPYWNGTPMIRVTVDGGASGRYILVTSSTTGHSNGETTCLTKLVYNHGGTPSRLGFSVTMQGTHKLPSTMDYGYWSTSTTQRYHIDAGSSYVDLYLGAYGTTGVTCAVNAFSNYIYENATLTILYLN